MFIKKIPAGPLNTNSYLVACQKTKIAVVIDPALGSFKPIMEIIQNQNFVLEKILLTHSHLDHFGDSNLFLEFTKALLFVHELDHLNVKNPGSDGLGLFMPVKAARVDGFLRELEIVAIGSLQAKVLHTPGHSPGGVCFYFFNEGCIFTGDTLFKGSFGNLSFPNCNEEAMYLSLAKLQALPKQTIVYPGHGENTTIGNESWIGNFI